MKLPSFSISVKQSIVFATVFLLIVLGSMYFFWYLPLNQEALEQKQYRCLQKLEDNIRAKIDNSNAFLTTLADDYNDVDKRNKNSKKLVADYIRKYDLKHFKLDSITMPGKDTALRFDMEKLVIAAPAADELKFRITYSLKQFFDPLLRTDIFDAYVIFKDPTVIYQTFPSGIGSLLDSLSAKKTDKTVTGKPGIKDIYLGGTDYKLFTQKIILIPGTEIVVAGLLTKERYDSERSKLPGNIVLLLSVIAVAVLLAMPWIKLYQMGSKDRMTATTGVLCLAVPMLLLSVLFFAFLQYTLFMRDGPDASRAATKQIADTISGHLTKEIERTYLYLRQADTIINSRLSDEKKRDISAFGFPKEIGERLSALKNKIKVNQVIQLRDDGRELHNWSVAGAVPPGKYDDRSYYKQLKNNEPLFIDSNYKEPYGLEPVISRTTGAFTTVMCIRSFLDTTTYTAFSFDVKCLDKTVLTPGFKYAIVDMNGNVLYHSDAERQLNENLRDEFSPHEALSSALFSLRDTAFTTRYSSKDVNVTIKPVKELHMLVVSMEDNVYAKVREDDRFFFCFTMLFAYFIILGLDLLLLFFLTLRKSHYKKHYFDVSWIGPDSRFEDAYTVSSFGNLLIIILLLICWIINLTFLQSFYILLSAASLSYLFQMLLYGWVYDQVRDDARRDAKITAIKTILITLLAIDIISVWTIGDWAVLIFQLITGILLYLLFFRYDRVLKLLFKNSKQYPRFSAGFSWMTFSRLIITSGLPVILFYVSVFNYEIKIIARYRQVGFIQKILMQNVKNQDDLKKLNIVQDGVWVKNFKVIDKDGVRTFDNPDFKKTNELFHQVIMDNEKQIPGIGGLDKRSNDSSWSYSPMFNSVRNSTWYKLPGTRQYVEASSIRLKYNIPSPFVAGLPLKGFIFWLILIVTLIGFRMLLHDVIRRLFGLNLPGTKGWETIDQALYESKNLNRLLFMIGPPGSGKMDHINKLISADKLKGKDEIKLVDKAGKSASANYFIADMILIPNEDGNEHAEASWQSMKKKALNSKHKLVIINHFEYDIKNPASNRAKLTLLEDLLEKNTAKIIIISTVHPVNFLDSLNQQKIPEENSPGDKTSPAHELERWHVLLGHFRIVIQQLGNAMPALRDGEGWRNVLNFETRIGSFLNELRKPIKQHRKTLQSSALSDESMRMKLGVTSHYFYMYIWQSLTKEEKFLLYDLAEDGLVNPYDDYNLILLISKGLVVQQDGVMRLFNQGFREFILTAIGQSEALNIQQEIRDNGNWNLLRTPLMLLIIALLVFLFTSQKEAYTDLLKYAAIITSGVTIFMQVFALFKPSAPSKT